MSAISLQIEGAPPLTPSRLRGVERLGEASTFEVDLAGPADSSVGPGSVLRRPARVSIDTPAGARAIAGVVTRFVVVAGDHTGQRRYRMTIESGFALLALRRPARTFQDLTVPEIIEQIVREAGYSSIRRNVRATYPKRRYVVQYQETDATFVRRLCEQHGLYFRFEPTDSSETFILEDDSTAAEEAYPDGIDLASRSTSNEVHPIAVNASRALRRAVGKVTLRDENPDKPKVALEGKAEGGVDAERDVEVYEAPGGFATPDEAANQARIRLESLRADASRLTFDTNALALAPGLGGDLREASDHHGAVLATGKHTVIAVLTRWDATNAVFHASIEAIPRAVPFRLPRVTPRPRIAGVQSAWVSGEKGQEVHPDSLGRVHLRFHWDLDGPGDHGSSLPVRAVQPHVSGPMILPRVGWEVFVMFDGGDPDRPYVVGRSYNAMQPPPLPLPANKTVSSIATDSSPGAGARTVIQMDDAAGREHLLFNAPFAMTQTVTGNQRVQTLMNENVEVKANRSLTVGAHESVSVTLGYQGGYGTRSVVVGAAQYQSAGGNFVSQVTGAELDIVGGALTEQVGNPVKGAANLLFSIAIDKIGAIGKLGKVGAPAAAAALGIARAAVEGAVAKGGVGVDLKGVHGDLGKAGAGALQGALGATAGTLASYVPGGEAVLAAVTGSSRAMPWEHGRPDAGEAAPGGGASGAGGADGGPAGPGPGYRTVAVSSSYTEIVGAVSAVISPGPVSWVTAAAAFTLIGSSHTTTAPKASVKVLGGLVESQGTIFVNSKGYLLRKATGFAKSTVSGALSVSAGAGYGLSADSVLTLNVGGSLTLAGGPVTFKCGASEIVAGAGGVLIKSPSITITGACDQAGLLTHK